LKRTLLHDWHIYLGNANKNFLGCGISPKAALAVKLGVSQLRITQVETGVGTSKIAFVIILGVFIALEYDNRVVTRKA
jgi:hypothetical protein